MICADYLSAASWAAIAAALACHAPVYLIALATLPAGAAGALFAPAASGLVPECVPAPLLRQAKSAMQVTRRGADLLGTALGGTLVALIGAPAVLAPNAASFLASAWLITAMRLPAGRMASPTTVLADLRSGWRDFASSRWVWSTVGTFSAATAALSVIQGVVPAPAGVAPTAGAIDLTSTRRPRARGDGPSVAMQLVPQIPCSRHARG